MYLDSNFNLLNVDKDSKYNNKVWTNSSAITEKYLFDFATTDRNLFITDLSITLYRFRKNMLS